MLDLLLPAVKILNSHDWDILELKNQSPFSLHTFEMIKILILLLQQCCSCYSYLKIGTNETRKLAIQWQMLKRPVPYIWEGIIVPLRRHFVLKFGACDEWPEFETKNKKIVINSSFSSIAPEKLIILLSWSTRGQNLQQKMSLNLAGPIIVRNS